MDSQYDARSFSTVPFANRASAFGAIHGDPGAATSAESHTLMVIDRLEAVLAEETDQLRRRGGYDLAAFNNRKSQGLVDLNRAIRSLGQAVITEPVRSRLTTLRELLEINSRVIQLHLRAVREMASVLAAAAREAESDGTYNPTAGRNRYEV